MEKKADIGLIGLAVMGENLVLNMANKGFTVAVYNRTKEKVDTFLEHRGKGKSIIGTHDIKEFIQSIERPRKIVLLIKAGKPVDDVIESLLPHLDKGDIIIDGGNSLYLDTERRLKEVEAKRLLYVGCGVSGGEEGALHGPSLMPGGSAKAWPEIKPIFQAIAAKVNGDIPCCEWIGSGGSGHYVKMIHNGIEYGDMQIITEAYQIMKDLLKLSADHQSTIFEKWNKEELDSYLIEITANILKYKDVDGKPIVEKILDKAGQKGTGKWTVNSALDEGIPLTLIAESVFARCLSAQKDLRVEVSKVISGPEIKFNNNKEEFIDNLKFALYGAKIISYTQGYNLMMAASQTYGWKLNFGAIAMVWRGGCIIRSAFLGDINKAYEKNPNLEILIMDDFFKKQIEISQPKWRKVCAEAVSNGIPVPSLSSALCYLDGLRSAVLPSNLLQAQRDYFGAHLYERVDKPRGEFFHTDWTGEGGDTVSSAYEI